MTSTGEPLPSLTVDSLPPRRLWAATLTSSSGPDGVGAASFAILHDCAIKATDAGFDARPPAHRTPEPALPLHGRTRFVDSGPRAGMATFWTPATRANVSLFADK